MGRIRSIRDLEAISWSGSEIVHALTDNSHLFLFAYSPRYRSLISWSANAEQSLGVKDAAVATDANLFLRHVHPDDRFLLMKDLETALGGKRQYRATYRWIRPDNNEVRWLHCRASLLESLPEPLFEGFIIDLSDEFTGAVSSLAGPDSISTVLAAFSTMVFTLDSDLRLIRINRPRDRQIFRFGDRSFKGDLFKIGRPLLACFSDPEQKNHFERGLKDVLSGAAFHYRTRIFEEETVYNLEVAPLHEGVCIQGLLVNVSDITEIVRMERRLAELQKMEGLRLIAAGVTHNFNNCLQGILGHATVIENHPANSDLVKQASHAILEAVAKASDLSKQLFKLGDSDGLMGPLDLNLAVMAAVGEIEDVFASGIKLAVSLGSPSPVMARREDLMAAIAAVIANAKESMKSGGCVTIKTFDVSLEEHAIEDLKGGRYAKVSVVDTGEGMNAEARQRCLEPFFTTKDCDPHSGLGLKQHGLGLSRAYATLRNCGGSLTIESGVGLGTTISMYIPAAETSAAISPAPGMVVKDPEILIVDDDRTVLDTTSSMLADLGYRCLNTDSSEDAVKLLRKHRKSIRLVLLDALMPGLSGAAALRRLQKTKPGLVVVAFSGAPPEVVQPLLDAGAAAVLRKPVAPGQLEAAISQALNPKGKAA